MLVGRLDHLYYYSFFCSGNVLGLEDVRVKAVAEISCLLSLNTTLEIFVFCPGSFLGVEDVRVKVARRNFLVGQCESGLENLVPFIVPRKA
ncbi:unnamed protein product [Linum tenue]|uniref:Uncharacterized protein n=1 Tax=Linum tenue TaxID=586396 RepID=A0AAV0LRC4_9ROSI|nr:unnamed protein product [Linum tenue]